MDRMETNVRSDAPLAIEPYDREWGVGVSGMTENPSPFPRINRMLKWLKETDSTADSQRARIITEAYQKYEMYPQNIKCAMALRDVLEGVDVRIWPGELIVGELAAPPNSAPIYPEFSVDWLIDEFDNRPMENRTNDRYVVSKEVQDDIRAIQPYWKGKTLSEAVLASYTEEERKGSHLEKCVLLESLFLYAGAGHVCANYEKLLKVGFGGIRRRVEEKMAALDESIPEDIKKREFYTAELIVLDGVKSYITRYGELAAFMARAEQNPVRKA